MNKSCPLKSALLAVMLLFVAGCASDLGGDAYPRGEARQVMEVKFATVESVRPGRLEGTKTPIGTTAGVIVGGVIGSTLGRGNASSSIGAVLGGVAGGVGGAAVEEGVTRSRGVEITIKLDNGGYLAVVQADGGENFQSGERVRLVGNGRSARVTR